MTYDPTDESRGEERGLNRHQLEQIQSARGITNAQIADLSEGALRGLLFKLDIPDRPRLRAEFFRLQEVDERGLIPADAMETSLQQLESMRNRLRHPSQPILARCSARCSVRRQTILRRLATRSVLPASRSGAS